MTSLADVQRRAWANKVTKGFNTTNVDREFNLLAGEVAEGFDAWRKGLPDLPGELADIIIYTAGLAQMLGIDLDAAVVEKLAVNEERTYAVDRSGTLVKAP